MSFLTILIPYFEIVMHHHLSGGSAEATQITNEERIDVKMLNTTQEALNLGSNAKPPPKRCRESPRVTRWKQTSLPLRDSLHWSPFDTPQGDRSLIKLSAVLPGEADQNPSGFKVQHSRSCVGEEKGNAAANPKQLLFPPPRP